MLGEPLENVYQMAMASAQRRIEKFDRDHSAKGPLIIPSAKECREAGLQHIRPGFIVFPDGAVRTNAASASELYLPSEDAFAKWSLIYEYYMVIHNRFCDEFQDLHQNLLAQAKRA